MSTEDIENRLDTLSESLSSSADKCATVERVLTSVSVISDGNYPRAKKDGVTDGVRVDGNGDVSFVISVDIAVLSDETVPGETRHVNLFHKSRQVTVSEADRRSRKTAEYWVVLGVGKADDILHTSMTDVRIVDETEVSDYRNSTYRHNLTVYDRVAVVRLCSVDLREDPVVRQYVFGTLFVENPESSGSGSVLVSPPPPFSSFVLMGTGDGANPMGQSEQGLPHPAPATCSTRRVAVYVPVSAGVPSWVHDGEAVGIHDGDGVTRIGEFLVSVAPGSCTCWVIAEYGQGSDGSPVIVGARMSVTPSRDRTGTYQFPVCTFESDTTVNQIAYGTHMTRSETMKNAAPFRLYEYRKVIDGVTKYGYKVYVPTGSVSVSVWNESLDRVIDTVEPHISGSNDSFVDLGIVDDGLKDTVWCTVYENDSAYLTAAVTLGLPSDDVGNMILARFPVAGIDTLYDRLSVFIGVCKYKGGSPVGDCVPHPWEPVSTFPRVVSMLRRNSDDVVSLTDEDATRDNILELLKSVSSQTRSLFVYVSTHGNRGLFAAYDDVVTGEDVRKALSDGRREDDGKPRIRDAFYMIDTCYAHDMFDVGGDGDFARREMLWSASGFGKGYTSSLYGSYFSGAVASVAGRLNYEEGFEKVSSAVEGILEREGLFEDGAGTPTESTTDGQYFHPKTVMSEATEESQENQE